MAKVFEEEKCEGVLLVGADNAFNRLNRNVALHNVSERCPLLGGYMHNCYRTPAKLHLSDGTFIESREGVTQGDNLAIYAVSMRGLIEILREEVQN